MKLAFTAALAVAVLAPHAALADPDTATVSPARRALSFGTALVPGFAVHGLGHVAAGDAETGLKLAAVEGLSLLIGGAGGTVLFSSGASRTVVLPATLATIGGVGLFVLSYLADLYGVLAQGGLGVHAASPAPVEVRLGGRYVYDPTFAYRWFLTAALALWIEDFAIEPHAQVALDDDNARAGASIRYRVQSESFGSRLDLRTGYVHHRYGSAGFSTNTLELELGGRLDLAWLSRSLRGAFAEGSGGVALEIDRFESGATEGRGLLLARFGFGLYLGGGNDGSEVLVYYDHRHDEFASGTKLPGLISGVFGHFGLAARWDFSPSFGAVLDAQTGSAHVLGLSLIYRGGG